MSRTPCQEKGLLPGTLAIARGDGDIPDESLVRVVYDDQDTIPAVEILMSAGEVGDTAVDRRGETLRADDARIKGHIETARDDRPELVVEDAPKGFCIWCSSIYLTPLE